jgi:hypothetical protein
MQSLERQGNMYTQQLEMDRISTLLQGSLGAAASKSSARASKKSSKNSMLGTVASAAIMSDRKLKRNISIVGRSPSGLNIYNFEYKQSKDKVVYQGVMADEVPEYAVVRGDNYDKVDYSKIDVDFKKIN